MSTKNIPVALFRLGRIITTPTALANLTQVDISTAIQRHQAGDWGDVDPHQREENELSLKEGLRLFSIYHSERRLRFWVMTEADRSVTTVLLPQDY